MMNFCFELIANIESYVQEAHALAFGRASDDKRNSNWDSWNGEPIANLTPQDIQVLCKKYRINNADYCAYFKLSSDQKIDKRAECEVELYLKHSFADDTMIDDFINDEELMIQKPKQ